MDEILSMEIRLAREINKARSSWPTPIAVHLEFMNSKYSPLERAMSIVNFLDSITSFLGSMVINFYLNQENNFPSEKFNNCLKLFFCKNLTLGEWISVIRTGLKYFAKNKEGFFMPELLDIYKGIGDPLYKIVNVNLCNILDNLNNFRKCVGHPS